jgi:hypothetical protein
MKAAQHFGMKNGALSQAASAGAHLQSAARRQLARAQHAQRLGSSLFLVALPITQQVSEKVLCSEGACNA